MLTYYLLAYTTDENKLWLSRLAKQYQNPCPCLLCLNSLKGLLSIRFMVIWLVITYTQLGSLLIEEITALKQHF